MQDSLWGLEIIVICVVDAEWILKTRVEVLQKAIVRLYRSTRSLRPRLVKGEWMRSAVVRSMSQRYAEVYAAAGSAKKFVTDVVTAWAKVLHLDSLDIAQCRGFGFRSKRRCVVDRNAL